MERLVQAGVIFLILQSLLIKGGRSEMPYITAHACEGSYLDLKCSNETLVLHIIRANYGRLSNSVCNEEGKAYSTDCLSPRAVRIVRQRCQGQFACSLPINNGYFGDPCRKVYKYIEIQYRCVPEGYLPSEAPVETLFHLSTTTQPALFHTTTTSSTTTTTTTTRITTPRQPSPTRARTEPTTVTSSSSSTTATSVTTTSTTVPPSRRHTPPASPPGRDTLSSTEITPSVTESGRPRPFCRREFRRNITWPRTEPNVVVNRDCPHKMKGQAFWKCSEMGEWIDLPDLSDCISDALTRIKNDVESGQVSIEDISSDLATATASQDLYGGDVISSALVMMQMAEGLKTELKNTKEKNRVMKATNVTKNFVRSSSNLLSPKQKNGWKDLKRERQVETATTLLKLLERSAFEVAETLNVETPAVRSTDENVAIEIEVVNPFSDQRLQRVYPTPEQQAVLNSSDSITLPESAIVDNADKDGVVKIVFISYSNLNQWLKPDSAKNETDVSIVNSKILSLSLNNKDGDIQLAQPIHMSFRHVNVTNVEKPKCSFWNFSSDENGAWSGRGCSVVTSNDTHTQCECNHLTNFAVLMDVVGTELPEHHEVALQVITYFGCIISIVCLFLTWLTFMVFRNLKSERTSIHKNLVFSLFFAEIIFLCGIQQTDHPVVCSVIAGFLHFFFLAAFGWMCLEGIQLYSMLIQVFEGKKSRLVWFYLAGYGIPAVIVGISAAVDYKGYGTDYYCWLRADNYFVWSFVAPVCLVITVNIVMLSIAVYMMCRHATTATSIKHKEKTRMENIRDWIKGSIVLVVLLGLTWAFGMLYINEESVVMAYVFTILNSLQGLFIFIFHCLMNEKVQKEYKKCARRTRWLPNCVRVGYGGQQKLYNISTSPSPSSSSTGPGNYWQKLWPGKKRRRSSGSSATGKSNTNKNLVGQLHIVNGITPIPEVLIEDSYGGINGDLSMVDASVVDSEQVTDYCHNHMREDRNGHYTENPYMQPTCLHYPRCQERSQVDPNGHRVDQDRLSNASTDKGDYPDSDSSDDEDLKHRLREERPFSEYEGKPLIPNEEEAQGRHLIINNNNNSQSSPRPQPKKLLGKSLSDAPRSLNDLMDRDLTGSGESESFKRSTPNLKYVPLGESPNKEPSASAPSSMQGQHKHSLPNLAKTETDCPPPPYCSEEGLTYTDSSTRRKRRLDSDPQVVFYNSRHEGNSQC
ncbi:adhesion G protein-coupled receptor L3 isoform X2 [Lingula anatina]|uniref:Adhesion G protein-coupled receptor L3 isoform X2 n=1 Tax=Lingula anatina TaxID=7574 RepID=A0A1S3K0T4_LINAN|nr:adhesion G protein-coupled receptor L3 isoform X2 [Lingula anatina]|eukprot:XP_013416248.1 adhesion G protein-coupled receptor L3 isoform X2 [Lingula anatina]